MKKYFRVMLGKGSSHAEDCLAGSFIGANYDITQDLSNKLPEEWREFNREFAPVYMRLHPGKTRIGAGLACGNLWTICKGIKDRDIVLCPDGSGRYRVGEVVGPYYYHPGPVLPHRRPVKWLPQAIDKSDLGSSFRRSAGFTGTVCNITPYAEEIEKLLGTGSPPTIISTDETVEDPTAFALEKHLEDFLVDNWSQTELGRNFDIFEEEGECVGQQYPSDTGPIDILAVSKDKKKLLVVELKKGRASDSVVGQTLRYMGYVQEVLAEEGQQVSGIIIALEDDQRLRRALMVAPNISFYRYQINFKLVKG